MTFPQQKDDEIAERKHNGIRERSDRSRTKRGGSNVESNAAREENASDSGRSSRPDAKRVRHGYGGGERQMTVEVAENLTPAEKKALERLKEYEEKSAGKKKRKISKRLQDRMNAEAGIY